jgi:hypothetical protein
MIRAGSKIILVGMKEEDLERLMIPMMSPILEIGDISVHQQSHGKIMMFNSSFVVGNR